jgi:hypothetical protein
MEDGSEKQITVRVNRQGWPIAIGDKKKSLDCLRLWIHFASQSAESRELEMNADNISIVQSYDECRFQKQSDEERQTMFSYNPLFGEVFRPKVTLNQN